CCTSNMHQGWPKFAQNLYYASADKGVASLIFSASSAKVKVGANDDEVQIDQETFYPFEEQISLRIQHANKNGITFPYHIRIPSWTKNPQISINGKVIQETIKPGEIFRIERTWANKDEIILNFPMEFNYQEYNEGSRSVERGPLVYVLDIAAQKNEVT